MARILKSLTRVKVIRDALPYSALNVRVARLCVLYEDLRIELNAAAEPSIELLGYVGDGYRRLYFLRRAIATLLETKGAFQQLDQCPEFQTAIRGAFTVEQANQWREAVEFLKNHDAEYKQIRDDVGGHFSQAAADYALREIGKTTAGALTIQAGISGNTAGPKLKFAGEIVAIAITRHKGVREEREFFEDRLQLLLDSLEHITRQVHILTYHYLWPRFR